MVKIDGVEILTTEDWGAQESRGDIFETIPSKIILHHMDTPNPPNHISQKDPGELARKWQEDHFKKDWIDTGQHFTISFDGTIMEGRHGSIDALKKGKCVIGAHCVDQNENWGVKIEGNHLMYIVTPEQQESLIRLCVLICKKCKIDSSSIYGHNEFTETQCPGKAILIEIPNIKKAVHEKLLGLK